MKKIIVVILVISSVFLLSSCNKEEETYQIGFAGTLSGTYASVGVPEMYGAQLAVKEINLSGGINGRDIELIVKDDKADPVEAVKVDNELKDMGIDVIIGHSLSLVATETVANANLKDILLLSPSIGTESLTNIDDNLIRIVSTVYTESIYITEQIMEIPDGKILLLYNQDNISLTQHHVNAFNKVLTDNNYDEDKVNRMAFATGNATDLDNIKTEILTGGYDVVYIASSNADAAPFVNYIKSNDLDMEIHLTSWAATGLIPLIETEDTTEIYAYVNFNLANVSSKFRTFAEDYKDEYGVEVDMLSVNSYDLIYLLKEVIEEENSFDAMVIKSGFLDYGLYEGINSDFTINEFGDTIREHKKHAIIDGEYVVIGTNN